MSMHAELIDGITIRPLRNGETNLVPSRLERLRPGSRRLRFGGAKNELLAPELDRLAQVDGEPPRAGRGSSTASPVGIARLARRG